MGKSNSSGGGAAGKTGERVVLSGKSGNEQFFVYVEPGMVENWRKDKSIPLVDVVQAFTIFEAENKGTQGLADKPPKSKLWNAFELEDETKIVEKILTEGRIVHASHSTTSSKGFVAPH